jgi:hypothetical protein
MYKNDAGRILSCKTEIKDFIAASRIVENFDQETDLRILASAVWRSLLTFGFTDGIGRS